MKYCVGLMALLALSAFAQDNQEPRKIGPDVVPPVIVEKTEPTYTEEAREGRLEGSVLLSVTINSEFVDSD